MTSIGQNNFDSYVYEKTKEDISKTNNTSSKELKSIKNELQALKANPENKNDSINTKNDNKINNVLLSNSNDKDTMNPVGVKFGPSKLKALTENIQHKIMPGADYRRTFDNSNTQEAELLKKMKENISY